MMFMRSRRGSKSGREARGVASPTPPGPFTAGVASLASSSSTSAAALHLQDRSGGGLGRKKGGGKKDRCSYRSQLEQEVQNLQKQLQEETNLQIALANANGHDTTQMFTSSDLPDKVRELLSSIAALEMVVSRLEEDLISLHFRLSQERNERPLAECHIMEPPFVSLSSPPCLSGYSWEQKPSPSRASSQCSHSPCSSQLGSFAENGPSPSDTFNKIHICSEQADTGLEEKKVSGSRNFAEKEEGNNSISLQVDDDLNKNHLPANLWHDPNELSEEMVLCMRNIFLHLSESSTVSSKSCIHHPFSPVGQLSRSSLKSFSGSTIMPSPTPSPSTNLHQCNEDTTSGNTFDPYGVNWKENQITLGIYSFAAEVSWMTVGKKQLDYAAEALERFRFLVEQLAFVDPASMSCSQRMAFWINLYNALIMHAYLAYGVPRSDMKLFSLMQKASYTVGGHSVSAADIEYVILKMKPPAHRPQIAMVLSLHKFKTFEELQKFSIDNPEPLAVFALSCGMYSSPAVRIFTPSNVTEELQNSLRDYVQASMGINDKGKLLVPKLLHCFAKGIVEDSLLVDWICRLLSPEQVSVVRDSTSQRKQRLLGARSFSVLPFDSRFRYLFLHDNDSSRQSS